MLLQAVYSVNLYQKYIYQMIIYIKKSITERSSLKKLLISVISRPQECYSFNIIYGAQVGLTNLNKHLLGSVTALEYFGKGRRFKTMTLLSIFSWLSRKKQNERYLSHNMLCVVY